MSTTAIFVVLVVALILVGGAVWFALKKRRSARIRTRFGPEYDRAVDEAKSPKRAEAALEHREKRVEKFNIRPLAAPDRTRFVEEWRRVQAHFVDDPKGAVTEADLLLGEIMSARGYPVSDFETRAADLSVDHPVVVQNYRAGHATALRHARGEANTEDLRQAMVHYRSIFDDLVGEVPKVQAVGASH